MTRQIIDRQIIDHLMANGARGTEGLLSQINFEFLGPQNGISQTNTLQLCKLQRLRSQIKYSPSDLTGTRTDAHFSKGPGIEVDFSALTGTVLRGRGYRYSYDKMT